MPGVACVKLGMHSVWTCWNEDRGSVFSRRSWLSFIVGVRSELVRSYDGHLPEVLPWLDFTPDLQQVQAERFSLGSGLETGHPDQARPCSYNFAMLKTVKLAYPVTLSSSCSCKTLSFSDGSWIFRLADGCSFFFFFKRNVVQLAGKPFEGLTVDRLAQRTVCALTVEPRRNQHCKRSPESLLIGNLARPNSFATKIAQFWARARMSIKYIAWLRSAQPFLFPGCSKLSSRFFIYFFNYFFLKWA